MDKKISKKEKNIIIALVAVALVAIIVLITMMSLYFTGYFEKEKPTLWTKDAGGGFKKHYVTGGTYPGVYAKMVINDGKDDYVLNFLLMPTYAPITVNNFIKYAESGFYEGTVIHRIVNNTYTFQGGGMTFDETNGYQTKEPLFEPIQGEFKSNPTGEYSYNKMSHFAGTISMARTNNKNSATSQFFISWQNYPGWDGDYAAFGFLVDTGDIAKVKKMAENAQLSKEGQPKTPIRITKVEISEVK